MLCSGENSLVGCWPRVLVDSMPPAQWGAKDGLPSNPNPFSSSFFLFKKELLCLVFLSSSSSSSSSSVVYSDECPPSSIHVHKVVCRYDAMNYSARMSHAPQLSVSARGPRLFLLFGSEGSIHYYDDCNTQVFLGAPVPVFQPLARVFFCFLPFHFR